MPSNFFRHDPRLARKPFHNAWVHYYGERDASCFHRAHNRCVASPAGRITESPVMCSPRLVFGRDPVLGLVESTHPTIVDARYPVGRGAQEVEGGLGPHHCFTG